MWARQLQVLVVIVLVLVIVIVIDADDDDYEYGYPGMTSAIAHCLSPASIASGQNSFRFFY